MPKLVVGAGYLGLRVAALWKSGEGKTGEGSSSGNVVYVLTRSAEKADTLAAQGYRPIVADITRPETLRNLPAATTVLWSVAPDRAAGGTPESVYIEGLRNVLAALPAPPRRFLQISSTSVYGQTDGSYVNEDSPTQPTAANGQICLAAESLLRARFPQTPDLSAPQADILRLAGIYGPGRLIARLDMLRAEKPLEVNPAAWLNLIHVDDAARIVVAIGAAERKGRVWLVADDRPMKRADFYGLVAAKAGTPAPKFDVDRLSEAERGSLGKRCANTLIRQTLPVGLTFPTVEEGVPHVLKSA
jgi:nucleoside-diphosphate-sugar epimerase